MTPAKDQIEAATKELMRQVATNITVLGRTDSTLEEVIHDTLLTLRDSTIDDCMGAVPPESKLLQIQTWAIAEGHDRCREATLQALAALKQNH